MKKFLFSLLCVGASLAASAETATYKLATSVEVGAEYLIAYTADSKTYAMSSAYSNNKYFTRVEVTKTNDEITISDETVVPVTICESDNSEFPYQLRIETTSNGNSSYAFLANTTTNNEMKAIEASNSSIANSYCKIEFNNSGAATITINKTKTSNGKTTNYQLQYNASSGQERFSCYTGSQKTPSLYKKVVGTGEPKTLGELTIANVEIINDELSIVSGTSLAISAENADKITIEYGETTLEYSQSNVIWTPDAMPEEIVTITATMGDETKEIMILLTVTLPTIDLNGGHTSALGDNYEFIYTDINPWSHDSKYGLKASGYISGNTNATDAVAASPLFDLTNAADRAITLTCDMAFNNYKVDNNMIELADFSGYAYVVAREESQTEWTTVEEVKPTNDFSWKFYPTTIDLSAYAGKKAQFGFRYVSTESCAGTWEIKNITIDAKPLAPTHDATINSDGAVDLEQGTKTITLTAPADHELWYKHDIVENSENTEIATQAETDDDGFTMAENGTVTLTISKNSSLHYYSKHSGVKSLVNTLSFVNASTTGIVSIEADNAPEQWFDLSGRKVATPAKGIYLLKKGNTTTKIAY